MFLEISPNSQENTSARVSFLIKLQVACNFIKKEALALVFSCEFCKIFKNIFFYKTPPVALINSALTRLILAKIKHVLSNTLRLNFWLEEDKAWKKNCVCSNDVIQFIIMKKKLIVEIDYIYRPRRRHRRKCTKYKKVSG